MAKGVIKFLKTVTSLTSASAMQSNLVSALFTVGSSEVKKKQEMEKRFKSSQTENKSVVVEVTNKNSRNHLKKKEQP